MNPKRLAKMEKELGVRFSRIKEIDDIEDHNLRGDITLFDEEIEAKADLRRKEYCRFCGKSDCSGDCNE